MIDAVVLRLRPASRVEATSVDTTQETSVNEITLAAVARTEFGKGAARRLRRAEQVPAVLYGHGSDPVHVALPAHATMMALKHANALLSIELDGAAQLAIAKDVQREPVRQIIEHVDLLIVRRGEKIVVEVPVVVVGESAPGTQHLVETLNISVEAEATNLPSHVEVSVEGLEAGAHVTGATLALPEGVVFQGDPDTVFVVVSEIRATEEEVEETDAEAAPAAAEAEPATED